MTPDERAAEAADEKRRLAAEHERAANVVKAIDTAAQENP